MNLDYCANWSYNRFRFFQPQIPEEGLYKLGEYYYIHCPNLTHLSVARDGTSLTKWFADNKYMITPVFLVSSLPAGAIRMREITRAETFSCVGMSHTVRDIYTDLAVELPEEFPLFAIKDGVGSVTVLVERNLTADEHVRLNETLQRLKLAAPYVIAVDSTLSLAKGDDFWRIPNFGDIDLMPARAAKTRGFSKRLSGLIRKDEEYWLENRTQLSKLLPSSGADSDNSYKCLINSSNFPAADIRNYLSLYDKVAFVAPLVDFTNEFYTTAKVNEDELVELARMGRVELLFPQAVDRYSLKLMERIAEAAPASMMLSRKLAVATIRDCRNRIPILYPDLSMRERADLMRGLLKAALAIKDPKQRAMEEAFVVEIGRIWNLAEELLHRRGAMANAVLGIASPLSEYFSAAGLPSRNIEFDFAAMTVEWAAALKANVYPVQTAGFSERPYTEILASLYSGNRKGDFPRCESLPNVQINDLLAVGREVPVLDFAKSFKGEEIARFRACVNSISKHQYNLDETKAAVTAFNKEVERYAGNAARVNKWELLGLVLSAGSFVPKVATPATIMSIGVYFIELMKRLVNDGTISNPLVVEWMDGVTSTLMSTTTDAVLVCRLKERLRK